MNKNKFLALSAVALSFALVATPVAAQSTAPSGWCKGGIGWQVSGTGVADPGCVGTYALDVEQKVQRYDSFATAEKARAGKTGTYWWEKPTAAGVVPTAVASKQPAQAQDGAKSFDWATWCSGGMSLVFSNQQGALNVGTLANITPPCAGGTVAVIEPWRLGCTAPQATNANCNPAKAWLASDWASALQWLVAGKWYEGALWYRPWETLPENTVQSTCVKAITPAGTVIASIEGYNPCIGVDRQPAVVTTTLTSAAVITSVLTADMSNYVTKKDLETAVTDMKTAIPAPVPTADLSHFVTKDDLASAVSKLPKPDMSGYVNKTDFDTAVTGLTSAINAQKSTSVDNKSNVVQPVPVAAVDWQTIGKFVLLLVIVIAVLVLVIYVIRRWLLPRYRVWRTHRP